MKGNEYKQIITELKKERTVYKNKNNQLNKTIKTVINRNIKIEDENKQLKEENKRLKKELNKIIIKFENDFKNIVKGDSNE